MAPNQLVIWSIVISEDVWETENNFAKRFCLETAEDRISSLAQAEMEIFMDWGLLCWNLLGNQVKCVVCVLFLLCLMIT